MATPLTADRLVAALRAEGVKVVEHPGWRGHHRNHKGPWGPVHGVMIHHTVTGPKVNGVSLCFNGYSALPGPLCHGVIRRDGTVHLVSDGRANHAGGGDPSVLSAVIDERYNERPPAPHQHDGSTGAVDGNRSFYGFECENLGDGVDPWPAVQVEAMVRASAALCRAQSWGAKSTIGHLEWSDWKSDPKGPYNVVSMPGLRKRIADRLAHPASWNPGDKPTTPKPPAPKPPTENDMEPIDFWNYRNAKADEASVKAGHGRIPDAYGYLVLTNQLVVKLNAAVDTLTKKVAELEARTRP
ncbi:N-acetylmuramoyl-L-alanine amidase [Streptomyces sp. NPDC056049]|uniref:peptidoglycan recognition protein family protein n=1 Tax=Streptomyces sp. NPDC056049 TaxID=3345693 RepID=UPI0035E00D3D